MVQVSSAFFLYPQINNSFFQQRTWACGEELGKITSASRQMQLEAWNPTLSHQRGLDGLDRWLLKTPSPGALAHSVVLYRTVNILKFY